MKRVINEGHSWGRNSTVPWDGMPFGIAREMAALFTMYWGARGYSRKG